MNRRTFLASLIFTLISLLYIQADIFAAFPDKGKDPKAKYVFLFIGDGMGLAQVNLTQGYLAALEGQTGFKELIFTQFPQVGFVSTFANDELITCSAAAGTALACGYKTNNGRIGMGPDGAVEYESIATKAKRNGYKVGIITSVSIDHATPAVFYAHNPDRNNYFEIGLDLTESNFDLFAGGGFVSPIGIMNGDSVDLRELARQNGFNLVNTREDFDNLEARNGKMLVLSPRLASEAAMPFYLDMDPGDLTLADYTGKAIEMLSGKEGFFMMVEGGKIDWACHANDAAATIQEVIAFDKAIEQAYAFYKEHPDETLIIVTADHETGGLSLGNNSLNYSSNLGILKYQKSSIEELIKIVAQFRVDKSGDPASDFARMMKVVETEIGLNSRAHETLLSEEEIDALKKVFNENVYGDGAEGGSYGDYNAFISAAIKLLAEKAGISWGSRAHTFVNVPVYAIGPGAEKFSGYIDNTDIPKIIGEMMGVWKAEIK